MRLVYILIDPALQQGNPVNSDSKIKQWSFFSLSRYYYFVLLTVKTLCMYSFCTHTHTHACTCTHTDALAIRLMVGSFIVLAEFERMRDMVARALTFWTEDLPLYHCILAL